MENACLWHWTTFSIWSVCFEMFDLFIVWFFMLILVADCSFLDDGYFVFEWGAAVNFDFFL